MVEKGRVERSVVEKGRVGRGAEGCKEKEMPGRRGRCPRGEGEIRYSLEV